VPFRRVVATTISNHWNWTTFSRNPSQGNDSSRVIISINIQLHSLCFSLRKYIFNHRDISCISFFNYSSVYFLINIYTDLSQMALEYLKDTEININNVLIITGDIRDNIWDLNFPYHFQHSIVLFDITDSFQLELSKPTEQVPTRYLNN